MLYSAILPTVNEVDNIPYVIELVAHSFKHCACKYEIIVIDDASIDGTPDVVLEIQKLCPEYNIRLLQRKQKLGLGSAYSHALKAAKGDFILILDTDLSHHPKYIVDLVCKQNDTGADIVSGTRYSMGGGVSGWPIKRMLMSRVANLITQLLFFPKFTDLTGSYRLYRRKAFEALIDSAQCTGFGFQMEVAVLAEKKFGFHIEQVQTKSTSF